MEIVSAELWDRFELLLGDKASILPPRPEGKSYRHSARLNVDKVLSLDTRDFKPEARAEAQRLIDSLKSFAENVVSENPVEDKRPDPSKIISVYYATFEHLDGQRHATGTNVTFTATSACEAIASVLRFWTGRQLYPEFFGSLFCVKIYSERIGPISETGQMFNGSSFPFFEWKIDGAGMPLEMYAASEILNHLLRESRAEH